MTIGQGAIWALSGLTMEQACRVAERWNAIPGPPGGQAAHRGGCSLACRRKWLPGNALIKREVGLGLGEEVPVRHRLGSVVPGGWSARWGDRRYA